MGGSRDSAGPGPGDTAPSFSLPDHEGNTVTLGDFRGQWLVLYFYPRDNTSGCTKEALDFSELLPEFRKLGADVVGVSPDSVASHSKFRAKHGIEQALLCDGEKATLKDYGAWGIRNMYGRESEGVVRSTFLIDPEGLVTKAWRKVRVRSKSAGVEVRHADTVLKQLIEYLD